MHLPTPGGRWQGPGAAGRIATTFSVTGAAAISEVTRILSAIERGDPHAAGKLLPLVYEELRKLAETRLAQEKPGQTLQPTALVHEAYLRLVAGGPPHDWGGRGHFFAAAAEAMRRILVDNARRKKSKKRGGDRARLDLDQLAAADSERFDDVVDIDAALAELAVADSRRPSWSSSATSRG